MQQRANRITKPESPNALRTEQDPPTDDDLVDEASQESFPASDAPASRTHAQAPVGGPGRDPDRL